MVTAMIRKLTQVVQACLLTVVLPSFYGCLGGGGGGGSQFSGLSATDGGTGSFSGGVGSGFGGGAAGGANLVIANGGELSTIHQPEPATMLLLGGGALAMAYYKNKIGRKI